MPAQMLQRIGLRFPALLRIRRLLLALIDSSFGQKKQYSQHGEDRLVSEILANVSPDTGIYIDVGANQPTRISNTYLLYQKGFRGIVVEPNIQMAPLYSRFRPLDTFLAAGCDEIAGLSFFRKAESTVLSGFHSGIEPVMGGEYIPMLTLDVIWKEAGKCRSVAFLTIDTEGYDLRVLKGASHTLKNTACLCIEPGEDQESIERLLEGYGFKCKCSIGCNLIFVNNSILKELEAKTLAQ